MAVISPKSKNISEFSKIVQLTPKILPSTSTFGGNLKTRSKRLVSNYLRLRLEIITKPPDFKKFFTVVSGISIYDPQVQFIH